MKKVRVVLGNLIFIHGLVLLGMFALLGVIVTENQFILLGVAMSFAGAFCGAFVRISDKINTLK